ncbi:hypothetical protein CHS0354_003774 [Potamilus streckersoni]|uniref:Helicase C-terminal domain-containing protein n=1 Tax=Potamilus streckersoni TaxID=2493646 RepID=A0AAE0RMC6_9BIVA|nr:hypothetical protein CHS0354_003774 [Potamilus streckersoni]
MSGEIQFSNHHTIQISSQPCVDNNNQCVVSRRIEVQQVSLVINYDLPNTRELYIHRIGRTGRFGHKGMTINFVKNEEIRIMHDIEQYYSTQIEEMPMNGNLYLKDTYINPAGFYIEGEMND